MTSLRPHHSRRPVEKRLTCPTSSVRSSTGPGSWACLSAANAPTAYKSSDRLAFSINAPPTFMNMSLLPVAAVALSLASSVAAQRSGRTHRAARLAAGAIAGIVVGEYPHHGVHTCQNVVNCGHSRMYHLPRPPLSMLLPMHTSPPFSTHGWSCNRQRRIGWIWYAESLCRRCSRRSGGGIRQLWGWTAGRMEPRCEWRRQVSASCWCSSSARRIHTSELVSL